MRCGPTEGCSTHRRSVEHGPDPGLIHAPACDRTPAHRRRGAADGSSRSHRAEWLDRSPLAEQGGAIGHRADRYRGGGMRPDRDRAAQRVRQPRSDRQGIQLRLSDRTRRLRHHLLSLHRLHLPRHAHRRGGGRNPEYPSGGGLRHRGRHPARLHHGGSATVQQLADQPDGLRLHRVHPQRHGAAAHPARPRDRGDHAARGTQGDQLRGHDVPLQPRLLRARTGGGGRSRHRRRGAHGRDHRRDRVSPVGEADPGRDGEDLPGLLDLRRNHRGRDGAGIPRDGCAPVLGGAGAQGVQTSGAAWR